MIRERKNVLLLIADDLGLYLNCYGKSSITSPNIDALAASGTRFTNAFASTASCSGSRSTIYTGLHTHQNGQYGLEHGWNHFQTFEHIETVPKLFNALDYQTGIIGKVHVGPRAAYPWEVFEDSQSRDVKWVASRADVFFGNAIETKRPFHLTVGFHDPHRDDTREGFANDAPEVVKAGLEGPEFEIDDVEVPSFITDVPELRTELVQYYKSIWRLDVGVGLVLKALKERGLYESTLVIFVSDNGAPFVNSKTTLYEAGVQLPLIIRQPHQIPGIINPNMISFLDILPTTLAWTGRDIPIIGAFSPPRLGDSMLPILSSGELLPESQWKHHVHGSHTFHEIQNYYPTRYLRTHKYKYHRNIKHRLDFPFAADLYSSISWEGIRNLDGPVQIGQRLLERYLFRAPEELYDLENDPEEVVNLAGEEEFEGVLGELRERLERWQYETGDAWLFRDGVSATVMESYVKLGLRVPNRFDVDLRDPGGKGVGAWKPPGERR